MSDTRHEDTPSDTPPDMPPDVSETGPGDEAEPDALVLVDQPSQEAQRRSEGGFRPIVPVWLRSWRDARAAVWQVSRWWAHAVGYHAVRVPVYLLRLLGRAPAGVGRGLRWWARWVADSEGHSVRAAMARDADAEPYLKLCRQRDQRVRFRTALTLSAATAASITSTVVISLAPDWICAVLLCAVVLVVGWVGVPADRPVIGRAVVAARVQRLTSDVVLTALCSIGIAAISSAQTKNPHAVGFPAPITRDGPGYRAEIDLPGGVTAAEVIERRPKLASALGRPLGCVWPEGRPDIHPGRLLIWVGDQDMNTARVPAWPLATRGHTDLFAPVPIGTDQRGRPVTVTLMFLSVIIGSVPRMGKTVLLRLILLIAALDPRAEVHVFDLKGTGDHSALEHVAYRYRCGDEDPDISYIRAALRAIRDEMRRRAAVIRQLPKDLCPDSKVTPELASKTALGLHPIVIGIDECHVLFEHPTDGSELAQLCEDLVRRGPAVGIIVALATQRPDAKSIPTGISANAVLRYCLKVIGHEANDMILGTGAYKSGLRATTLSFRDKGIGYLAGEGDDPRIVRAANINGIDADRIALRARAARITAGLLAGYATGHDTTNADTEPADTVLADVLAVIPEDVEKLWSETVVDRLAALRPTVYGTWAALETGAAKATQLAAALKPHGITTSQVWATDPATGKNANRRGIIRADIAHTHSRQHHAAPETQQRASNQPPLDLAAPLAPHTSLDQATST